MRALPLSTCSALPDVDEGAFGNAAAEHGVHCRHLVPSGHVVVISHELCHQAGGTVRTSTRLQSDYADQVGGSNGDLNSVE